MDGFSKNALCPGMHRSKNALHPVGEILNQDAFFLSSVFSSTKMSQESNSRFKTKHFAYVQKTTTMILSKKMK